MSGGVLYRLVLLLALGMLFSAAVFLGYHGMIPLDWLSRIAPDSGAEIVIVGAGCAAVILTLVIGLGRSDRDIPESVGDLPMALAGWSKPQPIGEWAESNPASPAPPAGFLTRPSSPMGRQLSPYLSYYHLSEPPFSIVPDPRYLVLTDRHLSALPILRPMSPVEDRFVMLIGEAGCGKTTILKLLQRSADARTATGFIPGITAQSTHIYGWIVHAFSISRSGSGTMTPKELVKAFINTQGALGRKAHLLIDEAQALTPAMLLELDELVNTPDVHGKLRVTLAGSPAFRTLLQDHNLRALKSPGHAVYEIPNMSYGDMNNYINKRLSVAGSTRDVFSETAKETIYYFSHGRPGLINMLCDLALAYGATDRSETISFQTILDIVEDRDRSGLTPFRTLPGTNDRQLFLREEHPA